MEPLKSHVLILICFVPGSYAAFTGIQEFLIDNGHHYVDLYYNSSSHRAIGLNDLFIARIPWEDIAKGHEDSLGLFMFDPAKDDLMSYLFAITKRQIRMSLLVITEPWDKHNIDLIKRHLLDIDETAFFYIATPDRNSGKMTWHQIISLKSGSALNQLQFANKSSKIIEKFNMQGVEITSSALTWAPYLTIDDCNIDGMDCGQNYGYHIDLMDNLAMKFNFTYISQKNVDNSWRPDGNKSGVMGDVESKKHDMSLSEWSWLLSRHEVFDFVPFLTRRMVLTFSPKQSIIDYMDLYTRAFVWDSWTTMIFTSGAVLSVIVLGKIMRIDDNMNGIQILTFTWWLFFTLINSYYGGVLTMFFTTPTTVPFETLKEVILAYPDWKVRFPAGLKDWIHDMAEGGNPDYALLWQRYQENSDETTYGSIESGLELIESGQNVLLVDENMLLGHIKSNPTKQKFITKNFREYADLGCILFSKESPLLPMFYQGVSYLRESGLQQQLYYKWFGDWDAQRGSISTEGHVLSISEMAIVFVMILTVFVTALIVLCGELLLKKFFKKFPISCLGGYEKYV